MTAITRPTLLTINLPDATVPAPLYRRYTGEFHPQRAYIELDLRDGEVTASHDPNIGGGSTWLQRFGVMRTYKVPAEITGAALHRYVEKITPMLERVSAGSEVYTDDAGDECGRLDDDAIAAEKEIDEVLSRVDSVDECAPIAESKNYLGSVDDCGVTASTTDEELDAKTHELATQAATDGVCLDVDEVFEVLRYWRDGLVNDEAC
jgi:hypothetical protein